MAHFPSIRRGRPRLFAAALMLGVFTPAFVSAGSNSNVAARVDVLELQAQNLSRSLSVLAGNFDGRGTGTPGLLPPANIGSEPDLVVAQSRDVASLNLRVSQMEEQMRVLVGQVEGLQFQMTQFQTLIERMQEDNEFRFQQLEGGGLGKTDAVTPSGGAMLSGGLPQSNDSFPADNLGGDGTPLDFNAGDAIVLDGADLAASGGGFGSEDSGAVFGADSTGSSATITQNGPALDLDFNPGAVITNEDADAQYNAGFDALMQGDYSFAQDQFSQFIALFPEHQLAPDATNWLGESLLRSGQYDQAAQVLFDGFQRYENSTRAPDILLKLAMALAGAGERDTACRTFGEVQRRFPNMGDVFAQSVRQEMAKSQC